MQALCVGVILVGLTAGCSSSSFEGVPIGVELRAAPSNVSAAHGTWRIDELLLAPTAIRIVACDELAPEATESTLQAKHVESTPFQNGTSGIWPVIGGDMERYPFGSLSPPPGEYCGVDVLLVPLDHDGLRAVEFPAMIGQSARFSATFRTGDDAPEDDVDFGSTLRAQAQVPLDNAPALVEGPATIVLSLDLERLLAGVTVDADGRENAQALLGALSDALNAELAPAGASGAR